MATAFVNEPMLKNTNNSSETKFENQAKLRKVRTSRESLYFCDWLASILNLKRNYYNLKRFRFGSHKTSFPSQFFFSNIDS